MIIDGGDPEERGGKESTERGATSVAVILHREPTQKQHGTRTYVPRIRSGWYTLIIDAAPIINSLICSFWFVAPYGVVMALHETASGEPVNMATLRARASTFCDSVHRPLTRQTVLLRE